MLVLNKIYMPVALVAGMLRLFTYIKKRGNEMKYVRTVSDISGLEMVSVQRNLSMLKVPYGMFVKPTSYLLYRVTFVVDEKAVVKEMRIASNEDGVVVLPVELIGKDQSVVIGRFYEMHAVDDAEFLNAMNLFFNENI